MTHTPTIGDRAVLHWSELVEGAWTRMEREGAVSLVSDNGRKVDIDLAGGRAVSAHKTTRMGWLLSAGDRRVTVLFSRRAVSSAA